MSRAISLTKEAKIRYGTIFAGSLGSLNQMNMDNIKNINFVVRTDTMDQYLKEIGKYRVLDAQEEKDLFAKYDAAVGREKRCKEETLRIQAMMAEGDTSESGRLDELSREMDAAEKEALLIRNEIIASNLRLNLSIAKFYGTGDILPDLINTGTIGMFEAFDNYDRRDVRFMTYAKFYIRRAIRAFLEKENLLVRPKSNLRIAPKVRRVENEFFLKNGRRPYPVEVIEILRRDYGIDVKDESDIYGAKVDKLESYLGEDDDNTFEDGAYFNEHTAVDNEYNNEINRESIENAINHAMAALTDREKKIICMAYGYGYLKEYKDKEIAQVLDLTSERVRQLRKGALKKMRQAYVAAESE